MSVRRRPGRSAVAVGTVVVALALGGCGGGIGSGGNAISCSGMAKYGSGYKGAVVVIDSGIQDVEAQKFVTALTPFQKCTGIKIDWAGTPSVESKIQGEIKAGNPPDLGVLPQPGLLQSLVDQGAVKPASDAVRLATKANYDGAWINYGTVKGQFYAPPLGANVKSLVWYSPSAFQMHGWKVPETWDEMISLSNQIAKSGIKPWCAGIESGTATGWPATDWVEDVLLRFYGGKVYDDWVAHRIAFNDPRVQDAINKVGDILRNQKFVNGGFDPAGGGYADVASIANISFQDGGLPIADSGECAMHRQASFYANYWPAHTRIAQDGGDVFAFALPDKYPNQKSVEVAGEFLAAFNTNKATQAVQLYMTSPEFTNAKAALGAWISANKQLEKQNVPGPIDKLSVDMLRQDNVVIRFDGSDMMPAAVGTGTFWTEMTKWIRDPKYTTKQVCDTIEASWPKS